MKQRTHWRRRWILSGDLLTDSITGKTLTRQDAERMTGYQMSKHFGAKGNWRYITGWDVKIVRGKARDIKADDELWARLRAANPPMTTEISACYLALLWTILRGFKRYTMGEMWERSKGKLRQANICY